MKWHTHANVFQPAPCLACQWGCAANLLAACCVLLVLLADDDETHHDDESSRVV